ncbi:MULTISPECIES: TetR/AcrR family transcriptional regulator [Haematobacter]|uniref:TetR family transcriptional regulator n=1 Tax=Haematobacter genomosp. 1 TaxID=366618 RepID=A0A212AAD9_9RHOB|nr:MULTISPECIES: TetR/AcrR family transcriptional regulator [Haematobacter]OWJ77122.1 TetR family transcriptional regulator [Haematobacter genomosp. 1]
MRVSRVQAEANRQRVIDEASQLFREHGYDGIGLKDLMQAAGMTPGGFYKQFASKDDLAAQATARAVERSSSRWTEVVDANPDAPLRALAAFYLSPAHVAMRDRGCPLATLGSDAPRHAPEVRAEMEKGLRAHLSIADAALGTPAGANPSPAALAAVSTMVGALVLARLTADEGLAKSLLETAANRVEELATSRK